MHFYSLTRWSSQLDRAFPVAANRADRREGARPEQKTCYDTLHSTCKKSKCFHLSASDRVQRALNGLRHDGLHAIPHERMGRVHEQRLVGVLSRGRFQTQLPVARHWSVQEGDGVVELAVVQCLSRTTATGSFKWI